MTNPKPSQGFHTYSEEKQREISRKAGQASARAKKTRTEIKRMLSNMSEVRDDAITTILQKNPDAIEMLYEQVFELALDGEKWAAELVINSTGLAAPKKTEATIKEEEISPEDAKKRLMEMMKSEGEG